MSEAPFAVLDTSTWVSEETEDLGKKRKTWMVDPGGQPWLFKQVRSDDQGPRGEDWAEKVAAEVAALLDLPHATVELAKGSFVEGASRGIISRKVLDDEGLVHGNELLVAADPDYEASGEQAVAGYTIEAVLDVLRDHQSSSSTGFADAAEQFVGYLVLDALIANTDRHHENWAVIQMHDGSSRLAPSYDHGSCLGFQEPEQRKLGLLERDAVDGWAARGRTKFVGRPSPVEAALRGLTLIDHRSAERLFERVRSLSLDDVRRTIERVPETLMSQADRRFALEVVRCNREGVLRHGS